MVERIFKLMEEKKITKYKLAKELKFSQSIFRDWETNKAKPSTEAIRKIAEYFGASTDFLITGKEYDHKKEKGFKTEVQALFDTLDRGFQNIAIAHLKKLNEENNKIKNIKKEVN